MIRSAARDLDFTKDFIPAGLRLVFHRFEIVLAQLFEVLHGLHLRDERRGSACCYLLSAPGFETYPHKGMFAD